MLATIRRRTIAACTAVLLVLGFIAAVSIPAQAEETAPNVAGQVQAAERSFEDQLPAPKGLAVRFYKSTDDSWTLVETLHLPGSGGSTDTFSTRLPTGSYRATFNEFDDGGSAWDTFLPGEERLFEIVEGAARIQLPPVGISFRGGLMTGHVYDQCGYRLYGFELEGFNTAEGTTDPDPANTPILRDSGNEGNGAFGIHTLGGPTKYLVTRNGVSKWANSASSFETATSFAVPNGQVVEHDVWIKHDVNLVPDFSGQVQTISGIVLTPGDEGIPGLIVRFYRSPDGAEPFALEGQVTTQAANELTNATAGSYRADLRPGEYRITVNEFEDSSATSRVWQAASFGPQSSTSNGPIVCLDAGKSRSNVNIKVNYQGGSVSGRVTDARGNPIAGATVEAYDASDPAVVVAPAPSLVTTTDANGNYTTHGAPGLTKVRFSKSAAFVPEWFDNATTFATSSALEAGPDQILTGKDAVLADGPIVLRNAPGIHGAPKLGSYVATSGAKWSPSNVKMTYQWFNKVGSRSKGIRGATSYRYKLRESDLGKRVWVRVTAHTPTDRPGVANAKADTYALGPIKRGSSVSGSGKVSGGKMKLSIKVKVTGISKPNGKVTVRYAKAKYANYRWVSTGKVTTKKVTFKKGKGKLSWKAPKRGDWIYEIIYSGSSKVAGSRRTTIALNF